MRRVVIAVAVLGVVAALAGCGYEGAVKPLPDTVVGTLPKASAGPVAAAAKLKGDPAAGKKVFGTAGCAACHTLAAAGAKGTVGPDLDQVKPSFQLAAERVTFGKGVMPAFKGKLTDQQIADVAAFVAKSTGGAP